MVALVEASGIIKQQKYYFISTWAPIRLYDWTLHVFLHIITGYAIAIVLPGFNDIERSIITIYASFDGSLFCYV